MRDDEDRPEGDADPVAWPGQLRQLELGGICIVTEGRILVAEERHVRRGTHAPAQIEALEARETLGCSAGEDDGEPCDERAQRGDGTERAAGAPADAHV